MSLTVSEKGSKIELIPEWIHLARCVSIIDLWTQKVVFEKREKEVHQIRFEFELPNIVYTYEDNWQEVETTKIIWVNFTASLNWKWKLKKFLESWKWKKFTQEELAWFDLQKVLWAKCQLQVIHSDDWQYANIENALPLIQWMTIPEWKRELLSFSIEEKNWEYVFDTAIFEKLPEWLQEKIYQSKELSPQSLEEQEIEIQKTIRESKPATTKDAEVIFSNDEASWKAFTKPVQDDPFNS